MDKDKTMNRELTIFRFLVRGVGTALIVMGLLFWSGRALGLLPLHMLLGGILVLCLWVLAGMGFRSGAPGGILSLALLFSLFMPLLGMFQGQLLPGGMHWTVEALHLIVGGGAMGLGEALIRRIGAARMGRA